MQPEDKLITLREALTPVEQPPLVVRIEGFVAEMEELKLKNEKLVVHANEFSIESEVEFQFADDMKVELAGELKELDARRMELTRPLDDFKAYIMEKMREATATIQAAGQIYSQKAMAYRRAEREKAEAARREAERVQREKQARLEAEARKREEAARKLKSEAGRQRAADEAEALRLAAQATPTTFVEAPLPQTSSSNVREVWLWEVSDQQAFFHWLADSPMEHDAVEFKKRPMDMLAARAGKSGQKIPGLTITQDEKFVKKARR